MAWTQGEDELVATGLMRYGMDHELISRHLLPGRTAKEIQSRQKNRCYRVEGNCIRVRQTSAARVCNSHMHGLMLLRPVPSSWPNTSHIDVKQR